MPQAIRTIQMKVDETGEVFNKNLQAFTLELPDYRKMQEADCILKFNQGVSPLG